MTAAGGRGARVGRTGIALVHEGELVLPAAGSEAQAEQALEDERGVVTYFFPVEIEVRSAASDLDLDSVADRVLSRLAQGLEGV
ncbi:hypothetical protein [Actinomycetospora straminea]|uniref:Uncharacterized protein n=1 Tax=Actinomycetospora straminea TaxID=663607 RepID=A0ABP9EJB4_9PSEU|nr:hypothetical protein [Actinomycetospora straminea]MDD7933730.1 hypothetical protein [Actinomycetospora straminea]